MNYPLDKYKFVTYGNKVIAISSYGGKRVRGVAACSKDDAFSLEKGKELAAARCALKVAQKRYKRASRKLGEAEVACANADTHYDRMICYYEDSLNGIDEARYNLENLLESL
jgi:hypothetical protein